MEKKPHILVIGGGLIGLSSADSLHAAGAKVTVIEGRDRVMGGASFANSGMVHLSQAQPWLSVIGGDHIAPDAAQSVLSLAQSSAPLIAARADALGLPMNRRAAGCIQMFRDTQSWSAAQSRYDALGIEYRRGPVAGFGGGALGEKPALFFDADRSGDACAYGRALAKDLLAKGVKIMTGRDAALVLEAGRVVGVSLGKETLRADNIVLCAGIQSAGIAAAAGLRLPIIPVAGYGLTFIKPDGIDLPAAPVMDYATRSCLTLFGHKLHLSGTVGQESADVLLDIWDGLIPDLRAAIGSPITPPWRGERPCSLTGKPLIGRSTLPGLWVNTGHAHMGWTLCAGAGALLCDMMLGGHVEARFPVTTV